MCRYYQLPPSVGDATIRQVVTLLPYAAVLRLSFACWMLSAPYLQLLALDHNPAATRSAVSQQQAYLDMLVSIQKHAQSTSSVAHSIAMRVCRSHTFPLFVLLVLVVLGIVLVKIGEAFPVFTLAQRLYSSIFFQAQNHTHGSASRTKKKPTKKARRDLEDPYHMAEEEEDHEGAFEEEDRDFVPAWKLVKESDPMRQQSAPYSGDYYRYAVLALPFLHSNHTLRDTIFSGHGTAYTLDMVTLHT